MIPTRAKLAPIGELSNIRGKQIRTSKEQLVSHHPIWQAVGIALLNFLPKCPRARLLVMFRFPLPFPPSFPKSPPLSRPGIFSEVSMGLSSAAPVSVF